jgi:hypothetical protein
MSYTVFRQYVYYSIRNANYNISHERTIYYPYSGIPNGAVEWLALLLRIWESLGSNLCPETGFLIEVFRGFAKSLGANSRVMP